MKKFLVRMMCNEPLYYSPATIEFTYVWAENENEAKEDVTDGICIPIDATEVRQ
ncbi:hypothetical protein [Saccharolobus caldissimus]|uniref:Uncharacterized protein n=1 Tax=Saccharolobus caldissimus TaxID=1702097 RepID=A0AAQ4CMG0_9CREN|nr:hypothetical protein [Saccharolobus caldissimus]BDB96991.1 hypothetical protein SACC_00080 [Saccharolobus caldissimus]